MSWPALSAPLQNTALTLAIAAFGAVVFWAISAPVYMLLGPAIAVTAAGLSGLRTSIAPKLRDGCFVLLGLGVGAGFDGNALAAMMRWPLAFLLMAAVIWAIMVASRALLTRFFGFDPRSALLASAPGHLSFVIAMASDTGADVARISITQSVRLLSLTLLVPFLALAMGVEWSGSLAPQGPVMSAWTLLALVPPALAAGWLFRRLAVPAPLLLGALAVSALGHVSGVTPGAVPGGLILPAYLVLGALIGTRFSAMRPRALLGGLGAGLAVTLLAMSFAGLGALPVAWALGMPLAHVLVAFAPGGLETMIAMGAVLGVVPGFVAACHVARLLVLSILLPMMLAALRPDALRRSLG